MMRASVKFREDRTPLVKAKVPLHVLGLPFASAVSAGDAREIRLDLSTAFDSGPSLRLSYRPNDPSNPFILAVKIGFGALGSPSGSPMSIAAEFSLIGGGDGAAGSRSPAFLLQLKPRIGDFSVRSSSLSPIELSPPPPAAKIVDGEDITERLNGSTSKITSAAGGFERLFSGVDVCARSVLPVLDRAAVKFQWGLRLPPELMNPTAQISFQKLPLLVMRKISVAHVSPSLKETGISRKSFLADVAVSDGDACLSLHRQIESLRAESGALKNSLEEVRAELRRENKRPREEDSNGGKSLAVKKG
ncbi:hypothetical protein QJS10_CPA10g00092 [Acorus calamus]|uniref:Uncharacterized protein n=1 Tax=Acorus calamus TaxID=4465 RepID=A0AAV9E2V9_ACOCL|nr:hypothetical protein QJS10_CPA10g00092 [Acorus calamus]